MFKEKLGICLYEEDYYTEGIIQTQDNTEKPSIKEINKVSNKKSTKKLTKEVDNKSIKVIDKVLINETDNKSINEPNNSLINKEVNSKSVNELDNSSINKEVSSKSINEPDNSLINELDNSSINKPDNTSTNKEVNSNITSWYDIDKFNKILATIDNSNFNHKNKIGKLKFNDINDLINSIKGNTISEGDAKKKINELNEIKKVEIKGKRLIESDNESNSSTKNKTVNESKSDNDSDNYSDNESENESKNENKKYKYYHKIKELNNWFETIDQTKSLEDQIEILKTKTKDFLDYYWFVCYYKDNKDLNYKLFKVKAAYLLNDLDEHLFEKIFGCKFAALVEKLINTVDKKEEKQIIIDDIKNNRDKICNAYRNDKSAIEQSGDLSDAVKLILEINEILTSNKVNNDNDLVKIHKI